MRNLAFSIGLVAGVCVQQPLTAQARMTGETIASIKPVYSTIFYEAPGPWKDLPIRLNLSATEIKALVPARSGKFAMIGITCSAISADRHLAACRIDTDPKGIGYEAVAKKLAERIVVDPAFSADTKSAVKFISLQFRVANSDSPDLDGPCWPPSCILEPAPPPPPPHQ